MTPTSTKKTTKLAHLLTVADRAVADELVEKYGKCSLVRYLKRLILDKRPSTKRVIKNIEYLISQGADVGIHIIENDSHSSTALDFAVDIGNAEIIKFLISKGMDVQIGLWCAIWKKNLEIARLFLSHGADVNKVDVHGESPFHEAVGREQNIEVVKFLVSHGADINGKTKRGFYCSDIEVDIGDTPLHRAMKCPNADVIEYLISKGADVSARNNYGRTPLHEAMWGQCIKVVKLLVSNGADIKVKDNSGETPLHRAVEWRRNENVEVVKYLVSKGADISAEDSKGRTPLDIAKEKHNRAMVKYFTSIGCQE